VSDRQGNIDAALRFMRLIWAVDHELERVSKRMEATMGVTVAQRMTLLLIGRHHGVSASGLAALMHVHPGTMSGILKRLEAAGLIERTGDESDARRRQLTLTARGIAANTHQSGTFESTVRSLIRAETAADLAATERVLAALAARLHATAEVEQSKEVRPSRLAPRTRASRSAPSPSRLP
jgi:MarR family transcriptional regulator, organic hydroperoxide resistance regulator